MEGLDAARRLLARSRRAVAFTGAGVSTASGVPDFRSPGPAAEAQERLIAGEEVPTCAGCGGPLKAATISFGQALRPEVLEEAFALAREADLLLVLGSSLVVYPAAAIPETVAARGAPMIIINREPTPLDGLAAVALRGEVENLLPVLIDGSAGGRIPVK